MYDPHAVGVCYEIINKTFYIEHSDVVDIRTKPEKLTLIFKEGSPTKCRSYNMDKVIYWEWLDEFEESDKGASS